MRRRHPDLRTACRRPREAGSGEGEWSRAGGAGDLASLSAGDLQQDAEPVAAQLPRVCLAVLVDDGGQPPQGCQGARVQGGPVRAAVPGSPRLRLDCTRRHPPGLSCLGPLLTETAAQGRRGIKAAWRAAGGRWAVMLPARTSILPPSRRPMAAVLVWWGTGGRDALAGIQNNAMAVVPSLPLRLHPRTPRRKDATSAFP